MNKTSANSLSRLSRLASEFSELADLLHRADSALDSYIEEEYIEADYLRADLGAVIGKVARMKSRLQSIQEGIEAE